MNLALHGHRAHMLKALNDVILSEFVWLLQLAPLKYGSSSAAAPPALPPAPAPAAPAVTGQSSKPSASPKLPAQLAAAAAAAQHAHQQGNQTYEISPYK